MNFFRVHTKKSKQSLNINIPCILCIVAIVIAASGLAIYRIHISDDNNLHDSLEHFFEWEVYSIKEESWWCTSECQELADEIIKCQKIDGGWTKDMHTTAAGVWSMSTIDNNATWGQVRFLAKCFSANGNNEYKSACIRGIECMLEMQYENGGWPQIADTEGDYHAHITFNDNAMTEVMETLKMISDRSEQDGFSWVDDELACSSSEAFEEGLDCILKCQIMVDGRLTAWCQQYDEKTLEPAGGRDYELPSICTKESTGIVRLLQTIPDRTPEIETSIQSAIAWFDEVKIQGVRFEWVGDDRQLIEGSADDLLWARFYMLDGVTPLFADRDGKVYDQVSEISRERRTGYDWYGIWPLEFME